MDQKSIFNVTVCTFGVILLIIHIIDILLKKDLRKDEKHLLVFFIFTAVHLFAYLSFTITKVYYTSNGLIMTAYSLFYIANNMEVLLLFAYALSYVELNKDIKRAAVIINLTVFGLFAVLDVINLFTPIFFYAQDGIYMRAKFMVLSQGYQLLGIITVFALTVFNKHTKISEKVGFSIYCILPLFSVILQNILAGFAIAYFSIIISVEILFLFVNAKKNIDLVNESKKTKEAEVRLMMSQIQPHFIYNTLSSISTLIKIDPDKAQVGLDSFTEYLRSNLSAISETNLIPFSDELKHIKTYLALEKIRFDDRLNVTYDIKTKNFKIPPLSIQPIVENAVKHGLMKKIEGGTITIKTTEDDQTYCVEISDDGVGFDVNKLQKSDNKHIGLRNVSYRLSTMCHGEMMIHSEIDKGTTVMVIFFKG